MYTDKNIMTAFIGLAQEADRLFERDYRLTQIKNGLRIEYDEVVQRISTELDISECNAFTKGQKLSRIKYNSVKTLACIKQMEWEDNH